MEVYKINFFGTDIDDKNNGSGWRTFYIVAADFNGAMETIRKHYEIGTVKEIKKLPRPALVQAV